MFDPGHARGVVVGATEEVEGNFVRVVTIFTVVENVVPTEVAEEEVFWLVVVLAFDVIRVAMVAVTLPEVAAFVPVAPDHVYVVELKKGTPNPEELCADTKQVRWKARRNKKTMTATEV